MMHDIDNVLSFYSTHLSDKFKKLSEPLQALELDGFWYSYVCQDGSFFQIGNMPQVADVYFSNHLYIHNPFVCHPKNYKHNQALITGDFPDEKFQQAQKVVGDRLGIENILFIYKKCGKEMHGLHFSSSRQNIPLNSIFISNRELLSRFADYFLQEWQPNLPKMDSFMFNIAQAMGPKFYELNPQIQRHNNQLEAIALLKKMGIVDMCAYEELTDREKECAQEYLLGKTASQIASSLDISPRTAEHHIENIKSKLGCRTKVSLFDKLQALHTCHLL